MSLKQQRGHQSKKKKVRDNRKKSARERSAKFEGANNAPVATYMAATVGLF
jgi:hypothetical protein